LIQKAEDYYGEERLLKAADMLRKVKEQETMFTDLHITILKWAELVESGMEDLLLDPEQDESPWIKQKENHGHRDFLIFYQVTDQNQLIARIDCAIESSLLVPMLSVFNESELYASWMPSWEKPIRLGVTRSIKLREEGRGKQLIHVTTALTWPFCDRDLIMRVMAVDVIEGDDDNHKSCIAIQALSQTPEDDPIVPEPTRNVVHLDFASFFLVRACPPDHPCLTRSRHQNTEHEPKVLVSCSLEVDPHIGVVPRSVQNFVTRTALGRLWSTTLQVAEDVRDGKRPMHKQAIDAKRELYDWVEERVGVMIEKLGKEKSAPAKTLVE